MLNLSATKTHLFRSLAVVALCIGSAFVGTANAGDVTVEIKGVGDKGNVMVALYKQTDQWMRRATGGSQMLPAKKDSMTLTFKDLPEGEYAVSLFVDENINGKLDSNAIGIPTEPFAFSNDASGNFGPPTFEQAKFAVTKDAKTIVINIK
ncbi:MAG: DUF2141 domain-containing protein [Burkholderiales bacterium]|jgi:uncharacterized protein (DUF2141 family)|nr:DUF2141 domain-containing protein [Betaproteobacteria bacterium]